MVRRDNSVDEAISLALSDEQRGVLSALKVCDGIRGQVEPIIRRLPTEVSEAHPAGPTMTAMILSANVPDLADKQNGVCANAKGVRPATGENEPSQIATYEGLVWRWLEQ